MREQDVRVPDLLDRIVALQRRIEHLERVAKPSLGDNDGNVIVGVDGITRKGLGRPYLGFDIVRYSDFVTPPTTTTGSGYTTLYTVHAEIEHPGIRFKFIAQGDDPETAGEVRLWDRVHDVQIADTVYVGDYGYYTIEGNIPDAYGSVARFDLEVRRVAGAGIVRIQPLYCIGTPSR